MPKQKFLSEAISLMCINTHVKMVNFGLFTVPSVITF